MIELFDTQRQTVNRQSSKGNQLKWKVDGYWYKADYAGYEGLAEYAASKLLQHSSLQAAEYTVYETEEIRFKKQVFLGAKSKDFLKPGQQLFTIERIFRQKYGTSFYQNIFHIENHKERLRFLVDNVIRITGLYDFGIYMNKILTLDAVILNEDRHAHNIAVLKNPDGTYDYCPIFDNGAGLLSDTTLDYPLGGNLYKQIGAVKAKTFCMDFDEQLDISEELYGCHLQFHISIKEIEEIFSQEELYPQNVRQRVRDVLLESRRKYQYLFQ